jgi:hypothetical protein
VLDAVGHSDKDRTYCHTGQPAFRAFGHFAHDIHEEIVRERIVKPNFHTAFGHGFRKIPNQIVPASATNATINEFEPSQSTRRDVTNSTNGGPLRPVLADVLDC